MCWELEIPVYVLSDSGVDKLLRFVSKISMARVFPPPSLQTGPKYVVISSCKACSLWTLSSTTRKDADAGK